MSLLCLPNELIEHIGKGIGSEPDLNALTQTNQLISKLLTPLLYRSNAERHNSSALVWAAQHGLTSTAKLCLEHGANTNALIAGGLPPLFVAAEQKQVTVLQLLLAQPGALQNTLTGDEDTLFIWACNSIWLVELLLAGYEVEVNDMDGEGRTAIWNVARMGHLEILRLLLETGRVNVNLRNADGSGSALGAARFSILRVYDSGDQDGMSLQRSLRVLEMLLSHPGLQFSIPNGADYLDDLLWHLIFVGPASMVELLLTQATENVALDGFLSSAGQTMLSCAASGGQTEVVEVLLRHGASVHSGDGTVGTPISWAAHHGYENVVDILLAHGADVDAKDGVGATALSLAAEAGYEVVVQRLLEAGADLWTADSDGKTPLWHAIVADEEEVIRVFLARCDPHAQITAIKMSELLVPAASHGRLRS
ncbi:ankyrin repeat-containing domain protein [Aspergillus spectabilis]